MFGEQEGPSIADLRSNLNLSLSLGKRLGIPEGGQPHPVLTPSSDCGLCVTYLCGVSPAGLDPGCLSLPASLPTAPQPLVPAQRHPQPPTQLRF